MPSVILSIKKEYSQKILSGEKRFEFRRIVSKTPEWLYIYETAPTKKVVGRAKVGAIIYGNAWSLWERCKDFSGISREAFMDYFKGKEKCFAYQLEHVEKFKEPLELSHYGISHPPQNFVYLKEIDNEY